MLSVCTAVLVFKSQYALIAYIIFWVYLVLIAFEILVEDSDGLISAVASVNCLGNLVLYNGCIIFTQSRVS